MKKNSYIACLEIDGVRRIFYYKSVSVSNLKRTIKRRQPGAIIIKIYPEPDLFC